MTYIEFAKLHNKTVACYNQVIRNRTTLCSRKYDVPNSIYMVLAQALQKHTIPNSNSNRYIGRLSFQHQRNGISYYRSIIGI